jgi:hypothetical protein
VEAYYARGKERLSSFMTSAMQIVAERETPTLQWTRVAPPSRFPASSLCQSVYEGVPRS